MIFFCPSCQQEVYPKTKICPFCGYDLEAYQKLQYNKKLILALGHHDGFTQRRAAELLGKRRAKIAVDVLKKVFKESDDPYLKAEIVLALYRIDSDEARRFFSDALIKNQSIIVKKLWRRLFKK
ncbi:MAG: hypothetical protein GXO77_09645 [Calditrichaeota bacterium]|nr:hypothetical protein [Calditrichota bacterium]